MRAISGVQPCRGTAARSRCVYSSPGMVEDLGRRAGLDDGAAMHDEGPVAHLPHDGEVVRDEEIGDPARLTDIGEEIEDLRLDRDVERRDRLVEDEHPGLRGEGPGDRHALTLAAGEVVGSHSARARPAARPGRRARRPARRTSRGHCRSADGRPRRCRRRPAAGDRARCRGPGRRSAAPGRDGGVPTCARGPCRTRVRRARMVPAVGCSSPMIILATVVLPGPDSPTIASDSPSAMENETSSTATSSPCGAAIAVDLAQADRPRRRGRRS